MTKEKLLNQKEIVFYSGNKAYVEGELGVVKSAMDEYAEQQMKRLLMSLPQWIKCELIAHPSHVNKVLGRNEHKQQYMVQWDHLGECWTENGKPFDFTHTHPIVEWRELPE